jgi:Tetracyclin repressor-like, C-terminal domain
MSSFNIGLGMTRYLDSTLGRLREGGFSIEGALDAWHTLDSHIYGFTLQELGLPFEADEAPRVSAEVLGQLDATEYPHVVEIISHVMQSGRVEDFEFGLDLILDGLERTLAAASR